MRVRDVLEMLLVIACTAFIYYVGFFAGKRAALDELMRKPISKEPYVEFAHA